MIKFLDIGTSIILILSIYLCMEKPKIGWFIYTLNCIPYFILMRMNKLYGMMFVAIILFMIGANNFRKAIRK